MFPALRLEVKERFTAVEKYLKAYTAREFDGELSQTARGLVFVQVYAIHEFTVKTVVEQGILAVIGYAHSYKSLRPSLLALFLDPELTSVQDSGKDKLWKQRLQLFDRAASKDPARLNGTPIPTDGSHFRHPQIQMILRVFGVKRAPTTRRRHLFKIDEVVDHRNAIAHGQETAAQVGRRYSNADVRKTIRQMKSVCLRLITIVEEYCSDPAKHCR
jgi:hypothetical protein